MGFASLREKAQEIGSNVASSVNELNVKVAEAAKKAAVSSSTPNNSTHGGSIHGGSKHGARGTTTKPAESSPEGERLESATKEELVEVLQKMNKKVKALNALRAQLQQKLHETEQERDQLKSMVINSSIMTKRPAPMERSDMMAASIQQLSEAYKEMEALEQNEIQHLKEALSFQPSGNGVSPGATGTDFVAKEKQLSEEHERAMASLKDSLEKQFKQETEKRDATIARLKESIPQQHTSEKEPSTPSGEGSASEVEDIKTRHAAEMEKIKKAAAMQMANFKKKVAAARSAELEKVRKEARDLAIQEIQQQRRANGEEKSTKDSDAVDLALMEQIKEQHAHQLQSIRENLQKEQKQYVETLKSQLLETHANEMTKLKQEAEANQSKELEALRLKFAAQAKHFHENALQKQKEAVDAAKMESEKSVQLEASIKIRTLEAELQKEKATYDAELAQLKEDNIRVTSLQSQLEEKIQLMEKKKKDDVQATKCRLFESFGLEKAQLAQAHNSEMERLRADLRDTADKEVQAAVSSALSREKEEITKLIENHESQIVKLKSDFEMNRREEIRQLKGTIGKEWQDELDKRKAEYLQEMKAIRSESDAKIRVLEDMLNAATDDNAAAQRDRAELSVQVENLTTKLNTLKNEKEAVLASLKDGENDLQKTLEESMSKQRELYEQMLQDLKTRRDEDIRATLVSNKEIATLRTQYEESEKKYNETEEQSNVRNAKLTATISSLELQIASLQKDLSDANSSLTQHSRALEEVKNLRTNLEECTKLRETERLQSSRTVEHLESQISSWKSKIEAMTDGSLNVTRALEETNAAQSQEIEELKTSIQQLQADKAASETIISKMTIDLEESRFKQEELKTSFDSAQQLVTRNTALESEVKRLEKILEQTSKVTEVDQHSTAKTLSVLRSKLAQLENFLEKTQDEHQMLVDEMKKSHEAKVAAAADETQRLKTFLAAREKEMSIMIEQYDKKVIDQGTKLSKLQEENMEIKKHLKSASENQESQSSKLQVAMTNLREELGKTHKVRTDELLENHRAEIGRLKSSQDEEIEKRIKSEVNAQIENHKKEVEDLKQRMADHVDKMKEQMKLKLLDEREKAKAAAEEADANDKRREEQVTKLAFQVKQMSEALKKERNDKSALHRSISEQKEIEQKLAQELEVTKKTLEETLLDSESTAQSLLAEQDSLRQKADKMEGEVNKIRAERNQQANKVEELSAKLEALTQNLSEMAEDLKKKDVLVLEGEKRKDKLVSYEKEVVELRQEINKLKLELTKNTQLVNRLQTEKETSERNHGQRTAIMGMLESQLAEVNEKNAEANAKLEASLYDLSQKEEAMKAVEDKLKETHAALNKVLSEKKTAAENLAHAQKGAAKKSAMQVEKLQRELQQLQQSAARKSAAAQKMIQEKETECAALRSANKKLQQEVDKGSLSDRKIFELAAVQSNREASQHKAVEARDKALTRLNHALSERDGDLAHAEKRIEDAERQVEELSRIRRREDVNMDYLKSIVVQFLSKPPGTSERAALLPVLATLLQFDANDYKLIEEGKTKVSWWGTVEPKPIGAGSAGTTASPDYLTELSSYLTGPLATSTVLPMSPLRPSSAEVSISTNSATPRSGIGRGTSLEF